LLLFCYGLIFLPSLAGHLKGFFCRFGKLLKLTDSLASSGGLFLLASPQGLNLVRILALECLELLLRLLELGCHLVHILGALDFGIIPFVRLLRVLGLKILVLALPLKKLLALFFNLLAKVLDLLLHTSLHLFEGSRLVTLLILNFDREFFLLSLRFLQRTFQVL